MSRSVSPRRKIAKQCFQRENKIKDLNTNVANIKDKTQQLINNHNSKMNEITQCKNMEIGNLRQQNQNLTKVLFCTNNLLNQFFQENEGLKEEFKLATDSTAGLKTALEKARDKLSDALVEGNVTVEQI